MHNEAIMGVISDTILLRVLSQTFRRAAKGTDSIKNRFSPIDEDIIKEDMSSAISDEVALEAFPDAANLELARLSYAIELIIRARPQDMSVEQRISDIVEELPDGAFSELPISLKRDLMAMMDEDAVERIGLERTTEIQIQLASFPAPAFTNFMLDKKNEVYALRQARLEADPELKEKLESFGSLDVEQKKEVLEFLAKTHAQIFDIDRYKIIIRDKEFFDNPEFQGVANPNGNVKIKTEALNQSLDEVIAIMDHEMDHIAQMEMIKELPNMNLDDPRYDQTMMMAAYFQVTYLREIEKTPFNMDYYTSSPMERPAYFLNEEALQSFFTGEEIGVPDFEERFPPSILTLK